MARIAGKTGTVSLSGTQYLNCTRWELSVADAAIDTSAFDNTDGWREYTATLSDCSGSFDAIIDSTKLKGSILDSFRGKEIAAVFAEGTSGQTYTLTIVITDWRVTQEVENVARVACSFRKGTGDVTIT